MIKSIKQIQAENRTAIIMACNPVLKNLPDQENAKCLAEGSVEKIYLHNVLFATRKIHFGLDIYELEPDNIWIYTKAYSKWAEWDLKKETLEEQTEETQRVINELLTKLEIRND